MAQEKGVSIDDVAEQGPGLVFVVYPKAVSLMPYSSVWAILFFAMLIFIGIDSQFCYVEGFCAAVIDFAPRFLAGTDRRRAIFVALTCFFKFLIGLSMITQGGMYIFQIIDYYSGCRIIMVVALFECIVIGWVYGVDRFLKNMEIMWERKVTKAFKLFVTVMWKYVTPAWVLFQFVLNTYIYTQALTYRRSPTKIYQFPNWAIALGWTLAYSSVIFIPLVAVVKIIRAKQTTIFDVSCLLVPLL